MYIRTERTNIRPFLLSDVGELYSLCSNEEATQFIPPAFGPESPAQTLKRIKRYIAHDEEHAISIGYVSLKNGRFCGRAGFSFIPEVNLYEVGYSLLPEFWGQGLATEITAALLDYAFYSLNLDMVCARTIPGNESSDNVLRKAGFNPFGERAFYIDDTLYLWNYYECDNPELLQSTSSASAYNMAGVDDGWDF